MTTQVSPETVIDTAPRREQAKRGFTLTEIAIVLGIIGLILGAIWVAAGAVYSNLRVSKATTQLLQITQAVRALYATSQVTGSAAGVDLTANLISAGVFPKDAVNAANTATIGPWQNSTIEVHSETINVAQDGFSVGYANVPQDACIKLLVSNTGSGRDPGMASASAAYPAAGTAWTGGLALPVTAVTATAAKGGCAAGNNRVGFEFQLRG